MYYNRYPITAKNSVVTKGTRVKYKTFSTVIIRIISILKIVVCTICTSLKEENKCVHFGFTKTLNYVLNFKHLLKYH